MFNCTSICSRKCLEKYKHIISLNIYGRFSSRPKTHYETLNLSNNCTTKEVREAFIALSKQCHPDKNRGNPKAQEQFVKVNEAYNVLIKPESRRDYDYVLQHQSQSRTYNNTKKEDFYEVHRHDSQYRELKNSTQGGCCSISMLNKIVDGLVKRNATKRGLETVDSLKNAKYHVYMRLNNLTQGGCCSISMLNKIVDGLVKRNATKRGLETVDSLKNAKYHVYMSPWKDPSFARNRNFSEENRENYYGVDGVRKKTNDQILFWIMIFFSCGFLIQILIIRFSGASQAERLRRMSEENSRYLESVRARAELYGSRERQIEEYFRRMNTQKPDE